LPNISIQRRSTGNKASKKISAAAHFEIKDTSINNLKKYDHNSHTPSLDQ